MFIVVSFRTFSCSYSKLSIAKNIVFRNTCYRQRRIREIQFNSIMKIKRCVCELHLIQLWLNFKAVLLFQSQIKWATLPIEWNACVMTFVNENKCFFDCILYEIMIKDTFFALIWKTIPRRIKSALLSMCSFLH